MDITKEEYLEKCKDALDIFGIKYDSDIIYLTDGGNSCIMNPTSNLYELFGGYSINSIAAFVAQELGKKTEWVKD